MGEPLGKSGEGLGGRYSAMQALRFPVVGADAAAVHMSPGMVPGLNLPPEVFTLPAPVADPADYQVDGPIMRPQGVTAGLPMEPTQAGAFHKLLKDLEGSADNEAQWRMRLQDWMRSNALDPHLRMVLMRRAQAYYKGKGTPRATAKLHQMRAQGARQEVPTMDMTKSESILKGGPGSGIRGHHTDVAVVKRKPASGGLPDLAAPATTKNVNAALEKVGVPERIVQGKGYVYFDGGDSSSWDTSSIPVYKLSQMSVGRVLKFYEDYAGTKLRHEGKELFPQTEKSQRFHITLDALEKSAVNSGLGRSMLQELLAQLQGMRDCYQTLHWQAAGSYGDHLLFERLYGALAEEVDGAAEKLVGLTGDAGLVDAAVLAERVLAFVSALPVSAPGMLHAEETFLSVTIPRCRGALESARELTDGLDNFLQGVADAHEGNVYLLQQRVGSGMQKGGPGSGIRGHHTEPTGGAGERGTGRYRGNLPTEPVESAASAARRLAEEKRRNAPSGIPAHELMSPEAHEAKAKEHYAAADAAQAKVVEHFDTPQMEVHSKEADHHHAEGAKHARAAMAARAAQMSARTATKKPVDKKLQAQRKSARVHEHLKGVAEQASATAHAGADKKLHGKAAIAHEDAANAAQEAGMPDVEAAHRAKVAEHAKIAWGEASMAKAEGDRGGRVIGHTGSGKPIYATGVSSYGAMNTNMVGNSSPEPHYRSMGSTVSAAHPNFTAEDHLDAAKTLKEVHQDAYLKHTANRPAVPFRRPGVVLTPEQDGALRTWEAARPQEMADEVLGHERAARLKRVTQKSLSKAEGDRGGHIIGHTGSGKPIYSPGTSTQAGGHHAHFASVDAFKQAHKDWSPADHASAASALKADAAKTRKSPKAKKAEPLSWHRTAAGVEAAGDMHASLGTAKEAMDGRKFVGSLSNPMDPKRVADHQHGLLDMAHRRLSETRGGEEAEKSLTKADPRGGKYHARVKDPESGKHRYFYSEAAYKARPDAHIRGADVLRDKLRKDILDRVGSQQATPGLALDALKDLSSRYGAEAVADMVVELVSAGRIKQQDEHLSPGGPALEKGPPPRMSTAPVGPAQGASFKPPARPKQVMAQERQAKTKILEEAGILTKGGPGSGIKGHHTEEHAGPPKTSSGKDIVAKEAPAYMKNKTFTQDVVNSLGRDVHQEHKKQGWTEQDHKEAYQHFSEKVKAAQEKMQQHAPKSYNEPPKPEYEAAQKELRDAAWNQQGHNHAHERAGMERQRAANFKDGSPSATADRAIYAEHQKKEFESRPQEAPKPASAPEAPKPEPKKEVPKTGAAKAAETRARKKQYAEAASKPVPEGHVRIASFGGEPLDVKPAHSAGLFHVHKPGGDEQLQGWSVTHGPSGMAAGRKDTKAEAIAYAKHLHEHAGDAGKDTKHGKVPEKAELARISEAAKTFKKQ